MPLSERGDGDGSMDIDPNSTTEITEIDEDEEEEKVEILSTTTELDSEVVCEVKGRFSKGDLTEQKWWGVLKSVPIVGTVYGGIRGPIYAAKGHREEAFRSLAGSLGNLAGTGAAIAGACVSGPLIVPVLASIVGGGVVQQAVGGGGEAIVDREEFRGKTGLEKEAYLYDKIFRDTPVVGSVYSLIRGAAYKRSNNSEEANRSFKNAAINGVSSGVAIGVGYGAARMAASVANNTPKLATLAKRSKILAKDSIKTTPSLGNIAAHEIEQRCADMVPRALETVSQILMILESTILCQNQNCRITKRLGFVILHCLDQKFRGHFMSSSFLTTAVLRAGLPFLQAVLCFKPSLQEHINVAREFVEIAEEELQAENLTAARRLHLELRLQLVQYFLQVLDMNTSIIRRPSINGSEPVVYWSSRPEFAKYRVRIEEPVMHKPSLRADLAGTGVRILNLDGGGTRGLLLLEFLEEIESRTNGKISEYFDYITGSSTGGLIALCLATGRSVADVRQLYFRLKDKIFMGKKPYKHKILEDELKATLGEFTTLRDIKNVKVIITASILTGKTFETKLLTNFEPETWSLPLWEVGRCTTAAPSYFEPYRISSLGQVFYDGGLGANNPTILSMHKISDDEAMEGAVIVSLGTGKVVDDNPNENPLVLKNSFKIVFNGDLKRLVDILVEQIAKSDGEPVKQAQKMCSWMGAYYYRLTPIIPEETSLDETDDEVLINLIFHTKAYIAANANVIEEICEHLISRCDEENQGACAS